jgi:4-amino-4-deoxy-L-arabinose transferase-like glycosyltransferase
VGRVLSEVLLGPRAVLYAVAAGLVLRLAADALVAADAVHLHEFGTIAHNIIDGHGYSYYAIGGGGQIESDGMAGDASDLSGRRLPSAFVPPGYTGLVTGALTIVQGHAEVVRLLQAVNLLAAAAMTVLTYLVGRELAGPPAGRAAAWIFALYPPMIYAATQVSSANVYLPVGMATLVLLARAAREPALWWTAAAGATLGVFCVFRSEAVVLIPAAALWLVVTRWRPARMRSLVAAGVLVIVAASLPGAWMVRNSVVFDRPVLTVATSGGFNLWIGNHDGATGSQKSYTVPTETSERIARLPVRDTYEVDVDKLYFEEALRSVAADPLGTAVRDVKKLAMVLTADFYDDRSRSAPYLLSSVTLLLLALAGMHALGRPGPEGWLLYGMAAFGVAMPTAFFVLARHRVGLDAVLIVFAGVWLARSLHTRTDAPAAPGHLVIGRPA